MNKNEKQLLIGTLIASSFLVFINIILLAVLFSGESKESTSTTATTSAPTNEGVENVNQEEVPVVTDIDELPPVPEIQTPGTFVTGEVTAVNGGRLTVRDFNGNTSEVNTTGSTTYSTVFTDDLPNPTLDSIQTGYFVSVECESNSDSCTATAVQITPTFQDED